jgi:hypothetical protein
VEEPIVQQTESLRPFAIPKELTIAEKEAAIKLVVDEEAKKYKEAKRLAAIKALEEAEAELERSQR